MPTYSVIDAIFSGSKNYGEFRIFCIARYAFGLPNADFSSRLVEETPFPQTPSAMEGQIKIMEVYLSNRQTEKDRSPTHSGRRQKKKN